MALHVENQQLIYFRDNEAEKRLQQENVKRTMLTAWFELNQHDADARKIHYYNIPCHYRWMPSTKVWQKRVNLNLGTNVIGRVYGAMPYEIERYHLRLLLLQTPGATSFKDLRTVNGHEYLTFREAAEKRGLIMDDGDSDQCLEEACQFQMPNQLRILFAQIIIFNKPKDVLGLWNKFKQHLNEDFRDKGNDDATADGLAVRIIDDELQRSRMTCSSFGLPKPIIDAAYNVYIDVVTEHNKGEAMFDKLNDEQRTAANEIIAAIDNPTIQQRCLFIEGPGGTGKTFLYETITHILRGRGQIVVAVAWTGIAAINLPGGRTVSSTFRIPLNVGSKATCKLNKKEKDELEKADLIIWDEAPMAPAIALDAVDICFRELMKTKDPSNEHRPFGGKMMLLGGDFRQILPVVKRGSREQIKAACIKNSNSWKYFKKLSLISNQRLTDNDDSFAQWLLDVGDGILSPNDKIVIPPEHLSDNLVDDIYGKHISLTEDLSNRCILTPRNDYSLQINEDVLNRLDGDTRTYISVDVVKSDDPNDQMQYPTDYLNSITPTGLPPHILKLKVGAPIILLRNLSFDSGLCNGTRLIVDELRDRVIKATVVTGITKGKQILLPRIKLTTADDISIPFVLVRRQFPVRLAFSMTINKSQGQTFDQVGVLLPEPVFTHGQGYVAYSRVRTKAGLKIQVCESDKHGKIGDSVITSNIVFKDILL